MTTNSVNKSTPYTPEEIRDMILGVDALVELDDDEKTKVPAINLDNAATTPAFKEVAEEVREKLLYYGSIGRGVGQKSRITTDVYVEGRDIIKKFVGLEGDIFENKNDEKYTVLHVNSTTDGMNKLASALIKSHRDMVLTTRMEHHANDLPWRERARTVYADVDEKGRLKIDDFERILGEYCAIGNGGGLIPSTCKIKYVTVTAASNVTGYVNDVHEIARIAHEYGAKIIVDGAQIVAHREFNMLGKTPEENIDFFVFSAHKMYSPFGGGVVIGLTDILNEHIPEFYGGGMVSRVADADADFSEVPDLYEAGSPNYPGVVGVLKAIEILTRNELGFKYIVEHEQKLLRVALDELKALGSDVILYGDNEKIDDRVGILVFNLVGRDNRIVAELLAGKKAVAVRHAKFCAHTYVDRLLKNNTPGSCGSSPGMVRASFGVYTTEKEVRDFIDAVKYLLDNPNLFDKHERETVDSAESRFSLPNDRG